MSTRLIRTQRPATTISPNGVPAYIRPARPWDPDAKMANPVCCHCLTDLSDAPVAPLWTRNEIGLLAPYCSDLDDCSTRMKDVDPMPWAYQWGTFYGQIMAALGLDGETYDRETYVEMSFELEELRVLVEIEGQHELVNPENVRAHFSAEMLSEIWPEDHHVDPAAPGLSLRQRAWSQWRVATVMPECINSPLVLDLLWLAYRGDEEAQRIVAQQFRVYGVPVYDAPKPNKGRERKRARTKANKSAKRSRAVNAAR